MQTHLIYDEDLQHESPDMNDNGDIVYVKEDDDNNDFQVFLLEWKNGQYDLNNEEQITDDGDDCHLNPGINNQGDIVWEQEGQIFL